MKIQILATALAISALLNAQTVEARGFASAVNALTPKIVKTKSLVKEAQAFQACVRSALDEACRTITGNPGAVYNPNSSFPFGDGGSGVGCLEPQPGNSNQLGEAWSPGASSGILSGQFDAAAYDAQIACRDAQLMQLSQPIQPIQSND